MIEARPYVAGDFRLIAVQPDQTVEARATHAGDVDVLAARGLSYTITREGMPIACGGLNVIWSGYAIGWGFAATLDVAAARAIVRQVRWALQRLPGLRRVEATARADFSAAQRFLETLGFERIAKLDRYGPDGADYWLFAHLPELRA